mgnify:CR=1 FL=1
MIKSQEECHEYKQMIAHKIKPILKIDAENDFDKLLIDSVTYGEIVK